MLSDPKFGSAEAAIWIAEFQLRAREEEEAYEKAREEVERK